MSYQNYDNLKRTLLENSTWPLEYMFKFIVPNEENKVNEVKELLPKDSKLKFKHTKNLKYVAITCIAIVDTADEIIEISRNVSVIEGVIAL